MEETRASHLGRTTRLLIIGFLLIGIHVLVGAKIWSDESMSPCDSKTFTTNLQNPYPYPVEVPSPGRQLLVLQQAVVPTDPEKVAAGYCLYVIVSPVMAVMLSWGAY